MQDPPDPKPDGSPMQGGLQSMSLRGVQLRAGPFAGRVGGVELRGLSFGVGSHGEMQLAAESAELQGLELAGSLDAWPAGPADWQFDPLAGLDGVLRAFITDAAWIVDADITMPVRSGHIDFDEVTVEHIGPNSSMGISRGGLYLDVPSVGRRYLYVFTAAQVPGALFERRAASGGGRIEDRGAIDIARLLLGLLRDGMPGRPADPQVDELLDRTRVAGDLQLGDGLLRGAGLQLALSGRAEGRNRVTLSASELAQGLELRMPQLQAASLAFEAGGLHAEAEAITGGVLLRVEPLRKLDRATALRLHLTVDRATVQGLRLSLARNAARAPA